MARRKDELRSTLLLTGVPENLLNAKADRSLRGKGLVLHGPPGVGKSFTAAGLLKWELWQAALGAGPMIGTWWNDFAFIRADALLQVVRYDSFENELEEAECVKRWGRKRFLVIDDLGAEKRTEWAAQTWHSLLSHRESGQLRTVVTTNYDSDDLEEMYAGWGKPLVSRLHALCEWKRMDGKDRRRK